MGTEAIHDDLFSDLNVRTEANAPLAPRTWYGLGGPARLLTHPSNVQQLAAVVKRCHDAGIETYVLGSGANLLVADSGVPGVVIQLDEPAFRHVQTDGATLKAAAGVDLMKLVLASAKQGLAGMHQLAGIPATVGGAVRMNAGGAYGDTGQSVRRVEVMDRTGQVYYRDRDDLHFGYRRSDILARFILSVEFELHEEDPSELMRQVKEVFMYKKVTQPMGEASAGCAFKNPQAGRIAQGEPPERPHASESAPPAGKLIEDAGLKGRRIGGAEISTRHANFVFTHPGAAAEDVLTLMRHVQQLVFERTGVRLEREVVVWPYGYDAES